MKIKLNLYSIFIINFLMILSFIYTLENYGFSNAFLILIGYIVIFLMAYYYQSFPDDDILLSIIKKVDTEPIKLIERGDNYFKFQLDNLIIFADQHSTSVGDIQLDSKKRYSGDLFSKLLFKIKNIDDQNSKLIKSSIRNKLK